MVGGVSWGKSGQGTVVTSLAPCVSAGSPVFLHGEIQVEKGKKHGSKASPMSPQCSAAGRVSYSLRGKKCVCLVCELCFAPFHGLCWAPSLACLAGASVEALVSSRISAPLPWELMAKLSLV